ncbi:MAG: hypothetical protein ACI84C_002464 [Flavobacteriales bacterium]|jgi:uncharacterized protein (TIGR01777 family)
MTKVLIAGGSGQVGQAIIKEANLRGLECHVLTRSKDQVDVDLTRYFCWDPENGTIDHSCFEGVDLLINLAGKSIDAQWNEKNKSELVSSRVKSVKCLADAMKNNPHVIRTVINASATGIYQSSDEVQDEQGSFSASFLGGMAQVWEKSTSLYPSSVKVVCVRFGLVLGSEAKLLDKIKPAAKLGVCTVFGSGEQWVSWIHEEDLARAVLHIGEKSNPESVYNLVAPSPLKARQFYALIHSVFTPPKLFLPVPTVMLKIIFKEKSELFLSSQNISSALLAKDFEFKYPSLEKAVKSLSAQLKIKK